MPFDIVDVTAVAAVVVVLAVAADVVVVDVKGIVVAVVVAAAVEIEVGNGFVGDAVVDTSGPG